MRKSRGSGKPKQSTASAALGFQVDRLSTPEEEMRLERFADDISAGKYPTVWPFIEPKSPE